MRMNNTLSNLVIFAVGAAIGSAVTWQFVKTKYEQIANEEIKSVKEMYARRVREDDTLDKLENGIKEYVDLVTKEGYTNYANEKDVEEVETRYIIQPEDFDTLDDYDAISLTCYADGVVVDDYDEVIEKSDVDEMLGENFSDWFGEYDDDSVYIRNDVRECDYEVLRDVRNYADVFNTNPYRTEG